MHIVFIFFFGITSSSFGLSNTCLSDFELRTKDNRIINQCDKPFIFKSINWYGASDYLEVPGGLDKQSIEKIIVLIKTSGFNAIRLPFSNHMLHATHPVLTSSVAANPKLYHKTPLEVFDKIVSMLTQAGLIVILNNHTTSSIWCCDYDRNGLWHHPLLQSTKQWIADWQMLASRYKNNPLVAAMDLRNEVRTSQYRDTIIPVYPNWGLADENDWHQAATQAGNAIHDVNKKVLIIVEGINWFGVPMFDGYRPLLKPVKTKPIQLKTPHKLVYEVHVYPHTGPKHTGNDMTSPGQKKYSEMDEKTLLQTLNNDFGFILELEKIYTAPVLLGEFGASHHVFEREKKWFLYMSRYILDKKISWSYWALNGTRANGNEESYGLLTTDWSQLRSDWRILELKKLTQM